VESKGIGSVRAGLHLRRIEERQERRLPGLPISDDHDVRHGLPVRGTPRSRVVLNLWKSLLEPPIAIDSCERHGPSRRRTGAAGGCRPISPGGVRI